MPRPCVIIGPWTLLAPTIHYTHHRECFTTFEPVSGDTVCLGNDQVCTVKGVGTIVLKTPSGSLKTNPLQCSIEEEPHLHAMGYLEKNGYSFVGRC